MPCHQSDDSGRYGRKAHRCVGGKIEVCKSVKEMPVKEAPKKGRFLARVTSHEYNLVLPWRSDVVDWRFIAAQLGGSNNESLHPT